MTTSADPAGRSDPSIRLILTYFGPLPASAQLFFRSCAENPTINWLMITDQQVDQAVLPGNIEVKPMTFAAFKQAVDTTIGMTSAMPKPYKLCDVRPVFGLMLADDLAGFDWWGYCDMDLVFGDIRKFITREILESYNKVMIHGHLSLYRNCEEANHYFQLEAPGVSYREVFAYPKATLFDEFTGIKVLLQHHQIGFFRDDSYLADIDRNVYRLQTIDQPNYPHQCFYWERGKAFRAFWDGTGVSRQEFVYIHFQQRAMRPPADGLWRNDAWFITPRGFAAKTTELTSPSEMDLLNQPNIWYDLKRRICSHTWHTKRAALRTFAPWVRHVCVLGMVALDYWSPASVADADGIGAIAADFIDLLGVV